ncbi:MAG: hypothetical protein ACLR2E_08755 [Lachnospiraceae bacterium]
MRENCNERKEKEGNFIFDSVLALLLFAGVSLAAVSDFQQLVECLPAVPGDF